VAYHLQVSTISRSAGRSATAAAAYRSGTVIVDERTQHKHDYTRKTGVAHSEIFVPEDAPAWAKNRDQLWNAVEQAERRSNSQCAREIVVAIPYGLAESERRSLVGEFARGLVERHQVAVDVAIHQDAARDWQGQQKEQQGYHAHILFTTRRLEAAGLTEKTREWNWEGSRETVSYWREQWSQMGNEHLKAAGLEATLDHRSYEEQGVAKEATVHLGVAATAMERRGMKTNLGALNRSVQGDNEKLEQAQEALGQVEQELAQAFAEEVRLREEQARVEQVRLAAAKQRQAQQAEWIWLSQVMLVERGEAISPRERVFVGENYVMQGNEQDFRVIRKKGQRTVLEVVRGKVVVDAMEARDLENMQAGLDLVKREKLTERLYQLQEVNRRSRPKQPQLGGYDKIQAESALHRCGGYYQQQHKQLEYLKNKWGFFKSQQDKASIKAIEQKMQVLRTEYEQIAEFLVALEEYTEASKQWENSPLVQGNRAEMEQIQREIDEIDERARQQTQQDSVPLPVQQEHDSEMEL